MKNGNDRNIRAFLAIDPPEHVRSQLAIIQRELKDKLTGPIRWVASEGIHLTLKFFGNIREKDVTTISTILKSKTEQEEAFRLTIKSIGVFPHVKRPRVIWLGSGGEVERLTKFASTIERALSDIGFPREERPFTPHWTLGRISGPLNEAMLNRWIKIYQDKVWGEFVTEELVLFQSELTPKGAIYTPLMTYRFGVKRDESK
ncbi:MAG: RNA 2',3'-cyclic phosphodiesterase [Syntrophales bacterium]|nr:RNA 2',3'-cyclic phosphodiesterase [Syntrophales bacterium]